MWAAALTRRALVGGALALAAGCTAVPEGVTPVRFDADRYLGTWYEIARLDHRFQRGDVAATATYALNPDGTIAVTNRGWRPDGTERSVRGTARFLGPREVASLAVTFRWPFTGGYHVIRLDPDYRIALVSGPTRDYLWLLARTPELPEPVVEEWLAYAGERGFPVGAIIRSRPPPA
ncbi:MAG: lipocalin family protein [Acetobacteraceae bacterium]